MKSIKNIKERVTDFGNLRDAYFHARRSKRFRNEVLEFSANLEDNLHDLQKALRDQTYVPGPYKKKVIHDPVDRLIMWQAFIHRVVQWAVYQVINPEFVRGYIEDSYACIKGRGSDAAAQRLFYFMQQAGRKDQRAARDEKGRPLSRHYVMKLDTSKFFYRIDHQVSLDLIGKKCNYDPWIMWLMDLFVNAPGEKFGFPPGKGVKDVSPDEMLADRGLAVGSLLNQMLANVNQNEVDHYAKRELRIHYYVRYMDDIVILSDSKAQLHEWKEKIERFMQERLKLELNPKKCFIEPISRGIDFCQYRVFPDHIKLKKATALRMKRNLKRIQHLYATGEITLERAQKTVNSYMGLLSHCDSYQLKRAIFGEYSESEWVEGWFYLQRDSALIEAKKNEAGKITPQPRFSHLFCPHFLKIVSRYIVYSDNYTQGKGDYISGSGQHDEKGGQLVQNLESNGRFHTDWLNMMYPRLKIAKNLLSDDGIILISIDDNENHNLRKICDEIFGANNYLNQFAWVSNITGRQISGRGAAKTWETVLAYCKRIDFANSLFINVLFAKSKMPDAYKGFNREIRSDKYGDFSIGDTLYNHNRKFNEETRPNLIFSIFYNPETEQIITGDIGEKKPGFVELPPHSNGDGTHKYHAWRWSKQKIANESHDLIVLKTSHNEYEIYTRIRDFNRTLLKDIITNISNGDSEVQKLLDGKKCFDYPKSVDLLKTLIGSISSPDIVLDFFSGSATTAHAVMQLNAEDGGNRKFIMVQLPEETPENSEARKAGYKNICEIGKERIRRAGAKIKQETGADIDYGFRVLKCDSANMKPVYYAPADTEQEQLDILADNIKEGRTGEDLLFQVMLELGVPLSSTIESIEVAGQKIFDVGQNYLLACFDLNVTEASITEIAKRQPAYFVMRDRSMANDTVAANFEQIFRTYSPDTVRKVL